MIHRLSCALFLTLTAVGAQAASLVYNIAGYTMNEGQRISFVALEFEGGVITRLYSDKLKAMASQAGERIDGKGATLLPGLIDAHGHVTGLGRGLRGVNLVDSTSEAEAVARVRAFIANNPGQEWVPGRGWNQVMWPGKRFPHRSSLDALADKPAISLTRVDGHAMWVNSAALKLAGIGPETPDPEGGRIIRDDKGRATGVLIDNAMNLVTAVMPPVTDEDMANFALVAMQALASQATWVAGRRVH
jgi:predicted amidohydrolase YtcJ